MSAPTADPRTTMQPARLAAVAPVHGQAGLAVFSVRPEHGPAPAFIAGQHTTLCWESDGQPVLRYYSIASAPEQREQLDFYVVQARKSGGPSVDLFHLAAGAPLWLGAPGGKFTLARTDRRHLAMVATGTGLAPYISMLRHLRREPGAVAAVSLWHGVRAAGDLGYREELEEFARTAPFPFAYLPSASRAAAEDLHHDPRLSAGRVDELLARVLHWRPPGDSRGAQLARARDPRSLAQLLPEGDTAIFLCGNTQMVRSVIASSEGSAYHGHLVYDKYW